MDCRLDNPPEERKVLDAILDPVTSELISMLEDGPKTVAVLCERSKLVADDVHARFSPLVEQGIILRTDTDGQTTYSADPKKLDAALSKSRHFDGTIDLVTQMDTFLN